MRLPSRTGSRWLPLPPRVRVLTPPRVRGLSPPRVRGLTRGFIPPPTSWVRPRVAALHGFADSPLHGFADSPLHGFADSPVALFRHPLRGFARGLPPFPTGSRTHPWLYSATHFVGSRGLPPSTGSRTHPPQVRGLTPPRVRGLTRGFIPPPTSWVRVGCLLKLTS